MDKLIVNEKIKNNPIVKFFWTLKTYLDVGIIQVAWVTGKLPEIAGIIIILNQVGFQLNQEHLKALVWIGLIGLTLLGYIFVKSGMRDAQLEAETHKNNVQNTIYRASLKILEEESYNQKIYKKVYGKSKTNKKKN